MFSTIHKRKIWFSKTLKHFSSTESSYLFEVSEAIFSNLHIAVLQSKGPYYASIKTWMFKEAYEDLNERVPRRKRIYN